MMTTRKRENIIAAGLGGAMLLAVVALFLATHYRALLYPGAAGKTANAVTNPSGLNIPSIDDMCKAAGATSANMESCKNDESAAAEFVIAWMGLHGFVANGAIDNDLIQLGAELGIDPASPLTSPDGLGDPSLGDPSVAEGEPNVDPSTGLPVAEIFESPAQIAMFCLSGSTDWLQLHDCISRYDPSSRFNGF